MPLLSEYIRLKKRYSRSVNLERDLDDANALSGYVVTPGSSEALERILSAVTVEGLSRSWTLTGAYGTGKSSFAHFLLSLCGPERVRKPAQKILREQGFGGRDNLSKLAKKVAERGFIRAFATAQREPIAHTVVRALHRGVAEYYENQPGRKAAVLEELKSCVARIKSGKSIDPNLVIELARETSTISVNGLIILLDELGKGLEFAALSQSEGDLYLLQQLAELKSDAGIYVIGLLHQSFADYSLSLSSVQKVEWSKIQGRFEDISFINSTAEALKLISHAIDYSSESGARKLAEGCGSDWFHKLSTVLPEASLTTEMIADILPLHPITAVVLPLLCNRFAQNDRSLFSFLTSEEPYSFTHFLSTTEFAKDALKTLKLDSLYDYFVDVVGANVHSRPHLSRWLEIQGRISESTGLEDEQLRVLKAIGILNLIATAGSLRASENLVALSMCDAPNNDVDLKKWKKAIASLVDKRVVTHRKQLDELRVWEGSDFNIEQAVQQLTQSDNRSLDQILNQSAPMTPLVAQRHSYRYGTFRFFERRYVASNSDLQNISCTAGGADGVIVYWVGNESWKKVPAETADGKPLIVISASNVAALQRAASELFALQRISAEAAELQTDGVARREVRQRALIARRHLDSVLADSFAVSNRSDFKVHGQTAKFKNWREFMAGLSNICDDVYRSTPILINELVNRRDLTSQGAKARRELIEALLENFELADLGLRGFGPEVSMYRSVLQKTGIHRLNEETGLWEIGAPTDKSLLPVWNAIEAYCLDSVEHARPIKDLFQMLTRPPFGLKSGVLPVLLAAMLLQHVDDICIYKDGTFVPVLGPEHFELLVKDPTRFSVKHFASSGLRAQVFKEIEELVVRNKKAKRRSRNSSLLSVVSPLISFVNGLPPYTKQTSRIDPKSQAVRDAIAAANQPDELLFTAIPKGLGQKPIVAGDNENQAKAHALKTGLLGVLKELQVAYDEMLNECHHQLCKAFKIDKESSRQALRNRGLAVSMSAHVSEFEAFIRHIVDEDQDDISWLKKVLGFIGDKGTENWRDDDVELFTDSVYQYANRFANFESLQANLKHSPGDGFEPKKITLTQPSGREEQKILWINRSKEKTVSELVEQIISEKLSEVPELHDAILSKLTERLLSNTAPGAKKEA